MSQTLPVKVAVLDDLALLPKNVSLAKGLNWEQGEPRISQLKRARYTSEFKLEAVRLVKTGQSPAAVSATLGVSSQTLWLWNWVEADCRGNLVTAGAKPVSAEQMDLREVRLHRT